MSSSPFPLNPINVGQSTRMPFRLDLITALLQNAFYMVQAVHNELSIDYSDANVYQTIQDVLVQAPFSIQS